MLLLIMTLFGCPEASESPAYTGPHADVFEAWPNATGPAGGYWVKMPAVPNDEVRTSVTPLGDATTHVFTSRTTTPDAFFMAITTDYPAGFLTTPQNAMDAVREGLLLAESGRTLVDEQKVIVAGHAARQYHVKGPGEFQMVARVFVIDNRVYNLSASSADPEISVWCAAWFDSFALTAP